MSDLGKKVKLGGIIAGAIVLLLILNPITIIASNERGVMITLGEAGNETLMPGLNFHAPVVQAIRRWSIVPKNYELRISIDTNGAISKDNQIIGVSSVLYWKYDESNIPDIAKNWSDSRIEDVINTSAVNAIKSVIGKYTIFDLAASQQEIGAQILTGLKVNTSTLPIDVTQINVTNFDWSPEFDKQINATMEAAQRVKQAEQQANIAEQENKKLTIEAEAKAKAMVAEAEGEKLASELRAEAKRAEGQGLSDYNRLISQNQQIEFRKLELEIEKIKAEKWDGHYVPNVTPMLPNGTIVNLGPTAQGR